MVDVILPAVRLADQGFTGTSVPGPGPLFIGPAQAKREIRLAGGQNFIKWPLKKTLAVKPVMVIAEAGNAILAGQFSLGNPCLFQAQIIKTKICRQMRLIMPRQQRLCLDDIGPFRKAPAPSLIILGDWVIMRKVKGQGFYFFLNFVHVLPAFRGTSLKLVFFIDVVLHRYQVNAVSFFGIACDAFLPLF
jgi:hypothetical protein